MPALKSDTETETDSSREVLEVDQLSGSTYLLTRSRLSNQISQPMSLYKPCAMGSHQPLAAELVLDKKLLRFGPSQFFSLVKQNNVAYHLGPVPPPGGDGSPFTSACQPCPVLVLQDTYTYPFSINQPFN